MQIKNKKGNIILELEVQSFAGIDLVKTFPDADFTDADFSDADLSAVNLSGADLSGADFRKANLSGADFFASKLLNADFRDANLTGTSFDEADLTGANFEGADLRASNIRWTLLCDCNLHDALIAYKQKTVRIKFENEPVDKKYESVREEMAELKNLLYSIIHSNTENKKLIDSRFIPLLQEGDR